MNSVILLGNLAGEPEIRTMEDGTAKCSFRLAVSRGYKNKNGQRDADFIPIVVWGKLAEVCGKYLHKGRKCAVNGKLTTRSYEDDDGTRHYITEVRADSVEFVGGNREQGNIETKETAPEENYGLLEDDDAELPFD